MQQLYLLSPGRRPIAEMNPILRSCCYDFVAVSVLSLSDTHGTRDILYERHS